MPHSLAVHIAFGVPVEPSKVRRSSGGDADSLVLGQNKGMNCMLTLQRGPAGLCFIKDHLAPRSHFGVTRNGEICCGPKNSLLFTASFGNFRKKGNKTLYNCRVKR